MYKYIILIISIGFVISSQAVAISTSDTCNTGFKQIYDFTVGDVFQYRIVEYDGSGGYEEEHITIKKYRVITKDIKYDTLIYDIAGYAYSYWVSEGNIYWGMKTNGIYEQLVFIDSTSNILNYCQDTLLYDRIEEADIYAVVSDTLYEQISGKFIGGENSLFTKTETDQYMTLYGIDLEEIYLNGLGLKYSRYANFEHGHRIVLEGYIINGDTTGVITSDQELIDGIEYNTLSNNPICFPNPVQDILYFGILEMSPNSEVKVYHINGSLVKKSCLDTPQLSIGELQQGLYFYIISDAENGLSYSGKFIKD